MSIHLPLPNEILCDIADRLIFSPSSSRSKVPWSDIDGITRASRVLRAIVLRSWYSTIAIHQEQDWSYLARRNALCSQVREAHVMHPTAFLDLFHLFPRLTHLHLCFLSFPEPIGIGSKLLWIPFSIVELRVALPDITDSFILATIAGRFPRLRSLELRHSSAWCVPPMSLKDVSESIASSDLALLPNLQHLVFGIFVSDTSTDTDPALNPLTPNLHDATTTLDESCALRMAYALTHLHSIEWTLWPMRSASGNYSKKRWKGWIDRGTDAGVVLRKG